MLDEPTNDLDMDTLDLLEDVLADYEGTLLLVSHDRDFIDRLASSTIALNGNGDVVETPGGWQDFIGQNPGFFRATPTIPPESASRPATQRVESGKPAKLSYKDQRRLEAVNSALVSLPLQMAKLETDLAAPNLYGRDPSAFHRLTQALETARRDLAASEDEWLALEERREAVEGGAAL